MQNEPAQRPRRAASSTESASAPSPLEAAPAALEASAPAPPEAIADPREPGAPIWRPDDLDDLLDLDEVETSPARRDRFDLFLAVVLTACTAFWGDLFARGPAMPNYLGSVLTSIGFVMPLALRRSRPLLMVALMSLAGLLQTWLVGVPTWALVAFPLASYSVARKVDDHSSRLVVLAGGVGSVVGPLRWLSPEVPLRPNVDAVEAYGPLVALCLAWVVIPYLLGRRDREAAVSRHERRVAAQERHAAELQRREQQTRVAEARVRNEIARELHDVVAHSLSVIIVQADGGKALARKKPEQAADVLEVISETGRDALGEMRRIVGVLRSDPEAADQAEYRPAPGLSDIPGLVAHAGDRVQLSIAGAQPAVSPALGVTAYRVVQESLTNFLKHAGPAAQATVAVIYQPTTISIEVANDAPSGPSQPLIKDAGPGYGLQGMHERVTTMGGRLSARPVKAGGWVVRAVLPLGSGGVLRANPAIGDNGNTSEQNSERA